MKIGIVIPAYNEHENILNLIKQINKNVNSFIVIIDDSNTDKTKKLFKKKKKNILYIHRGKKLGRGSAVIFGLKKLLRIKNVSCYMEMDADMSHNPSEIKKKIKFFKKNSLDLLISSRYLKRSKIINWPISRKILSKMSNLLARLLLGIPVTDYTNGYRIYSKRAVNLITRHCGKIGDGFIILSEIILILSNKGMKISEIDTIFVNRIRGLSSVNFKLIAQSLIGLSKLYLMKKFNKV